MQNENKYSGGVWQQTAKSGLKYYLGKITIDNRTFRIALFEKKMNAKDKSPDFSVIMEDVEINDAQMQSKQTQTSEYNDIKKDEVKPASKPELFTSDDNEDAPF